MDSVNILNYLTMVSNENLALNFSMHIVTLLAVAMMYFIKTSKVKGILFYGSILTLYLSVAINAFVFGNPFHLVTFGALGIFTLVALLRGKGDELNPVKGPNTIIALLFIIIGFWYPEFVKASALNLFMLSPLGIVPCPTMLVSLGLMTLCYPKVNMPLYIAAIVSAVIYGVIGTFKFGVYLDITLLLLVIYSVCRLIFENKVAMSV